MSPGPDTYVADTHAIVWFLEGNPRLGSDARSALSNPNVLVVVPTIVLAEIAFLHARKRIPVAVADVLAHVGGVQNSVVYPLDEAVIERLPTALEMHDAIIVATALVYREVLGREATVVTRDAQITSSGLVPVAW